MHLYIYVNKLNSQSATDDIDIVNHDSCIYIPIFRYTKSSTYF